MAQVGTIDHFVVPVDDLPVVEELYDRVLGALVIVRHGLNVRERAMDLPLHIFVEIAGS